MVTREVVIGELITVVVITTLVRGVGMVVNIEAIHGPVAARPPLEFIVTALTSHQYTVLYCKVS